MRADCGRQFRLLFLVFLGCVAYRPVVNAQEGFRAKRIFFTSDTLPLDTFSIVPGTVSVKNTGGTAIDTSLYQIDYVRALIIANGAPKQDTLLVSYRVFPYLFTQKIYHKDVSRIQNNQLGEPYVYTYDKKSEVDFFKTEGLSKSGSIARGLSFGNNQDVVLNSSLNLQLAGKLSDNVDLLLAATDQNVPVQPDGNTQQIQEFDKVFIQFGIKDMPQAGKTTVTAGDFLITKPKGYFMNFNKKLQGLSLDTKSQPAPSSSLGVKASVAVSKGKFARNLSAESSSGNTFNGQKQERNQGPYKLRGAENEPFIVVLAGTETVYLDGLLLERGQENDYVIDYNTAEIAFTPKHLITKDKRISVEFQYSDKNYARSLIHAGAEYENKKVKARVNVYSEQDNKNKPLQQDLTDPQKLVLASVGDTLQNALWPAADSIPFNSTEILYDKKDTTIFSFFYPGIYEYSTDSSKAHYRLSFSLVGAGNGNYRLKQSAANGKVYEWVRPDTVTGRPGGSYEPVILLLAPKQKQMAAAGADICIGKNSVLSFEGAGTNHNINTFSALEKSNDDGWGVKLNWDASIPLASSPAPPVRDSLGEPGKGDSWKLLANVNYEFVQQTFSPIERFRSVEFDRDWNRSSLPQANDQHIRGAKAGLAKKQNSILYEYRSLTEQGVYEGVRHGTSLGWTFKGFTLDADGSLLESKTPFNRTNFLRHRSALAKGIRIGHSLLTLGIKEQAEENLVRDKIIDSLLAGSARYYEREPFAEFRDSSGNKYRINYKHRMDYGRSSMKGAELHRSTFAESFGGSMEILQNPNSQLRITGNYRRLDIVDSAIARQKPENTVIGRTEYNFSLLKGLFTSTTFYEVGSGLELKRDFIFLEVAAGQGTHIWTDYNLNGIKELNEFEISPFPNEANYIKVWVPTDDYISTYTNQFSEVFSVRPAARWNNKTGFLKFVSHFANQTAWRTDKKTTNPDLAIAYNPFLSDTKDSTLVTLNSSLRNTVYFNQTDPVFGLDYTYQDMRNKTLLENDTAFREHYYNELHVRWNLARKWTVQGSYKDGVKKNNSKFFTARNYLILYNEAEPKISFQPGGSFRVSMAYKYAVKKNALSAASAETASIQNLGGEARYNALNKGSLTVKGNFILVAYNAGENTPLAYEMLEGLKEGRNYTWSAGYSRTLSGSIQLNITYEGRQSPGIKTIHTGSAQVRALF